MKKLKKLTISDMCLESNLIEETEAEVFLSLDCVLKYGESDSSKALEFQHLLEEFFLALASKREILKC